MSASAARGVCGTDGLDSICKASCPADSMLVGCISPSFMTPCSSPAAARDPVRPVSGGTKLPSLEVTCGVTTACRGTETELEQCVPARGVLLEEAAEFVRARFLAGADGAGRHAQQFGGVRSAQADHQRLDHDLALAWRERCGEQSFQRGGEVRSDLVFALFEVVGAELAGLPCIGSMHGDDVRLIEWGGRDGYGPVLQLDYRLIGDRFLVLMLQGGDLVVADAEHEREERQALIVVAGQGPEQG
jgi:hypothetical protein